MQIEEIASNITNETSNLLEKKECEDIGMEKVAERKNHKHWTIELAMKECKKYNSRNEFRLKSFSAYHFLTKIGILDEILPSKKKPADYWCKKTCQEESLKYSHRKEFETGNQYAYNFSRTNGFLDEICKHMEYVNHPKNYWTHEKCKEEALKYQTRLQFHRGCGVGYVKALLNNWDDVFGHMVSTTKPRNYWTKDKCKQEALKYKNKRDFRSGSSACYTKCKKNKWIDELCSHMVPLGDRYKRGVYVYEFSDKTAYIGLTFDFKERFSFHLIYKKKREKSPVYKYSQKTGLQPIYKELSGYLDVCDAQKLEGDMIDYYKKNGWNVLNVVRGGSLGSPIRYWDKDRCFDEAIKYKLKSDLIKNSRYAYSSIIKNGWQNECFNHMSE